MKFPLFTFSSLLLACSMAAAGCGSLPGRPKPGPEVPRPDAVLDFTTLYNQNCSACHGEHGNNGPSYPLSNPIYQALVDERRLHQVVANGEPGTQMPAFAISAGGSLTGQQVDVVVKGMRGAWYKPAALNGLTPPPYLASKPGDAMHGQQIYTNDCASCHGAVGTPPGKTKSGSITQPEFLALVSDQALRTIVIAGRPDIGQPDWRSEAAGRAMTDQEVTDVVAWLSSQRPGASPAAPHPSVLSKKIAGGLS